MAKTAPVPCIICGKELENEFEESENQPYEGTAFSSSGHEGSTVFDPMDGSFLEINFCDPCIKEAGTKGRVLLGRDSRPLLTDEEHVVVGSEKVDRPYLIWKGENSYNKDDFGVVGEEEVGSTSPTFKNVTWSPGGLAIAQARVQKS